MNQISQTDNKLLETSSASAVSNWDDLLDLQVRAFSSHEMEFLSNWPKWNNIESVIDIGCGNGSYLSKLSSLYPEKSYSGLDISKELITLAKERNKDLEFVWGDFFSFYKGKKYDLIIMRFIVQHLKNFPAVLSRAETMLNPGGSILIVEPDFKNSKNSPDTPLLKSLLNAYGEFTLSDGQARMHMDSLSDLIPINNKWNAIKHENISIINSSPFMSNDVVKMYRLWVNLIEGSGLMKQPFSTIRNEIEEWAGDQSALSAIQLHVYEIQKT